MLRLVVYFLVVAGLAAILSWLADNPGSIVVNWQGYIWDTNVFQMAIILSVLAALIIVLWTALRSIWQSPAAIGNFFNRRREKRGLEALSSGMIAIGAGDRSLATRYAIQARKSLPNEPMTHLLRAQAAQLAGDRATSRRSVCVACSWKQNAKARRRPPASSASARSGSTRSCPGRSTPCSRSNARAATGTERLKR